MNYTRLLSSHHVAVLHDWLADSGELYVHIGAKYDRAIANTYFITELGQLKNLLSVQSRPLFEVYIFRGRQFPVRGIASQDMVNDAWRIIPYGRWYTIVSPVPYPKPVYYLGAGKDYSTLKQEIAELEGRMIAIGVEPMDTEYNWRTILSEPVNVMYFAASENIESYEEYTEHPDRYAETVKNWEDPSWPK